METTGDLLYRALMAGYWVLLSRTLARPLVGDIAFANAVAVPLGVIVDAGFSQYLLREYSVDGAGGLPFRLKTAVRLRYAALAVNVIAVTAAVYVVEGGPDRIWIGLFVGISYALDAAGLIWLTRPRAQLNAIPYLHVRMVQAAGGDLLTLALWFVGPYDAAAVTGVGAAAYLVAAGIALRQWMAGPRWQPAGMRPGTPASRKGRAYFAAFAILTTVYSRLDAIIVEVALGPAALATYTLAFKLIEAARVAPGAVARALLAAVSRSGTTSAIGVVPRPLGMIVRLCLIAGVGLAVSGPFAMRVLFGVRYAAAGIVPLRVLALTLPGIGFTGPLSSLFLAWRAEWVPARNAIFTLIATVILAVTLARTYGLLGVAAAVVGGEMVSVGQYLLALRRYGNLRWQPRRSDYVLGMIAAAGTLVCLVTPPLSVWTMVLGVSMSAAGIVALGGDIRRAPA